MSAGWLFSRRTAATGGAGAMSGPWCIVVHTTEIPHAPFTVGESSDWIGGWPYPSHVVADPIRRRVVQCVSLDEAGKALYNAPGGVQTNFAGALQVEVHWRAVDPADPSRPDLPADAYQWLASEVFAPICRWAADNGFPIDMGDVCGPFTIPGSASDTAPQRMATARWDQFRGWAAHAHVPENDPWDGGALNLARLATLTTAAMTRTEADMTPEQSAKLDLLAVQMVHVTDVVELLRRYLDPQFITGLPDQPSAHQATDRIVYSRLHDLPWMTALAEVIAAKLPGGTGGAPGDAALIARAVADEMARRMGA